MAEPLIHSTAIVSKDVALGKNVRIGPYSIIEAGAIIGDNCAIHANVHICGTTQLGANSEVFPFTVLGSQPQDLSFAGEQTRLIIGTNTTIREHATMHCGTKNGRQETKVGDRGYFMGGTHVAHDCIVGDDVIFAQNAVIGGHVIIGNGCNLGALSGVHQFSNVGKYAFIGSMSVVTRDVIPYGMALGNRAHLAGLNVVGLKRRDISRKTILNMRSSFKMLFCEEATMGQRVDKVHEKYGCIPEVMEIIDFIRSDRKRPLCLAHVK